MKKTILATLAIQLCFGLVFRSLAQAASDAVHHAVIFDCVFSCAVTQASTCVAPTSGNTAPPNEIQTQNAKIIIGIAKTDNLGQQGALIGLMVGLAESGLHILANSNVPISESNPAKQGDGSDHHSVGVFQQQPDTGWSTIANGPAALSNQAAVWQDMDPAFSAEAFFGSPAGSNAPNALSKGVQNKPNWQSLPPEVVAQQVQASGTASGSNYLRQEPQARTLLSQLWDSAPAIPLPVPFSGGAAGGAASVGAICGSTLLGQFTGDEHQLAQQIVGNSNITYDYGANGIVAQPFKDLAANQQADTAPNSGSTNVSTTILKFILSIAQNHKINVSSLTTQHTPGDIHSVGDAVDFNYLDGTHLNGRDPGSVTIITIAEGILPSGSGFGQTEDPITHAPCGPQITLSPGFIQFPDTCTHLHVQVPRGTP